MWDESGASSRKCGIDSAHPAQLEMLAGFRACGQNPGLKFEGRMSVYSPEGRKKAVDLYLSLSGKTS
jgi:hypothetical protein